MAFDNQKLLRIAAYDGYVNVFAEKVNFKGMSRYTKAKKIHINSFIINQQIYYGTGKHIVYPFDIYLIIL